MRQVLGPGGIFAVKLFILSLIAVILTIISTLLVREMHRWIGRKNLKVTLFALTLFAIFAALVFAGQAVMQQPEIGAVFTAVAVFILAKVYRSGESPRWEAVTVSAEKACEITGKQIFLGLSCAILPAGGIGSAHLLKLSFYWKIILIFLGFLTASIVLAFGIWRMGKKDT